MPHIDDGTLHALLDGALRAEEPDRADRVEGHLETCADCRARLEQAAVLRDEVADVLARLDAGLDPAPEQQAAGLDTTPDFQDVLDRAASRRSGTDRETAPLEAGAAGARDGGSGRVHDATGARAARLRRQYRWTRGLAWAATIVVALGTGYLVRDLAGPTGVVPRRDLQRSTETLDSRAPTVQGEPGRESPEGSSPGASIGQDDAVGGAAGLDARQSPTGPEAGGPVAEPSEEMTGVAGRETPDARAETGRSQTVVARDEVAPAAADPAPETEALAEPEAVHQNVAGEGVERAADLVARQRAVVEPSGEAAEEPPAQLAPEVAPGEARVLEVSAEQLRAAWRGVSLEQAQAEAGPVFVLPRADVVAAELGAQRSVRTRQRLPGGVVVSVLQVPAPTVARPAGDVAPDAAEAGPPTDAVASLIGVDLDSAAATVTGLATASAERDGVVLTVTGPLPPDILQALAVTATPRAP